MNISIIYGGASAERKISIQTGLAIAEAIRGTYKLDMISLDKGIHEYQHDLINSDLVFNALHGGDGENGNIQAYLDLHQIKYTGSGAKASKIAMDKNLSKLIARSINVPTPNWFLIKKEKYSGIKLEDFGAPKFKFPYVVKPSNEGSTNGLSIIHSKNEFSDAIGLASNYSNEIIIEEYIPGREITIGILGRKTLPIIEIKPSHDLYDFECKYTEGMSDYIVPAVLSESLSEKISKDAIKIYNTIGCSHYARADFRINNENEYFFLEINTLPGLTKTSLFPKAAQAADLDFFELVDTIIKIAKLE